MEDSHAPPADGHAWKGHHCTSIVMHVVMPATVMPTVDASDLHAAAFVLADFNLPLTINQSQVAHVVDFDTGPPPNDLVVTLHRLVI